MCMGVLPECMAVHHVDIVPTKVRRGWLIPWNWRCRQLWATTWVLGITPGFSERAGSALNPCTVFLVSKTQFQCEFWWGQLSTEHHDIRAEELLLSSKSPSPLGWRRGSATKPMWGHLWVTGIVMGLSNSGRSCWGTHFCVWELWLSPSGTQLTWRPRSSLQQPLPWQEQMATCQDSWQCLLASPRS